MYFILRLKKGNRAVLLKDFSNYFDQRSGYTLDQQNAYYKNADTGVYFLFQFQTLNEGEEYFPIVFSMKLLRPISFALEAELELKNISKTFDLEAIYPATDKGAKHQIEKDFNGETFLYFWRQNNVLALEQKPEQQASLSIMTLPVAKITSIWQWNRVRQVMQSQLGAEIFVPKIILLNSHDGLKTAVAWPDLIPSLLPFVDLLIISRQRYTPSAEADTVLVEWSTIQSFINRHKNELSDEACLLNYAEVPSDLVTFLGQQKPYQGALQSISLEDVLEQELF